MTHKDLREKAKHIAYRHFFCNVGEPDWPLDPGAMLHAAALARRNITDLAPDNGKDRMEVWEPFEDMPAYDVAEAVDNLIGTIYNEFVTEATA